MKRLLPPLSRLTALTMALSACWCLPAQSLTTEEAAGLREGYVDALRSLAAEGLEAAVAVLIAHETGVARQHGTSGLDRLRSVELELADELARIDANLLLPLVALHEQAHLAYRQQPLEANPYHARAALYLQAKLYSEQLATTADREIASDLFVSLAGYFQEGSPGPGSVGLYVRALQLDPANPAALLALATAREQLGRYRNALLLLERLVGTGSAGAEARLRHAINLDRLGQRSEAAGILERLTSEAAADWVRILAFQQLARIRMDQERFETAHSVLTRGLAEFPADPGLSVGLVYLEERLGLLPEGSPPPAVAKDDLEVSDISARYRYARPGYEYLDAVRERLREEALQNLPHLAEVLSAKYNGP